METETTTKKLLHNNRNETTNSIRITKRDKNNKNPRKKPKGLYKYLYSFFVVVFFTQNYCNSEVENEIEKKTLQRKQTQ